MKCELCNKRADHAHHKFSQTKLNRKLYGDLLDDSDNICFLCYNCHLNKPIPKFTEIEFCEALGIEPRSKTEIFKKTIYNLT